MQVAGMALAKLAALLVLMGGVARADKDSNAHIRGELHLLLVGDPGTGEATPCHATPPPLLLPSRIHKKC